ncbi:hypothetical protein TG4357_00248 [Thalassovita gelatinovora]|uniref:Uncharacterized protein n=1 Tax=Thalassovita gelatinovora TaxID=53501 RepID=A0A0P1F4F7_THAGE|nr:hypothetical protein TG4357_00248 [Thalassovita gelatinovora]SEQ08509.1 hypothetical protein SAMN04488043_103148 [Thalassovita gelatinovora]
MRHLATAFALFICTAFASGTWADTAAPAGDLIDKLQRAQDHAPIYSASCCKTCRKGKACGNSCISKSKSCHKGGGCACDG